MNKLERLKAERKKLCSKMSEIDKKISKVTFEKYEGDGTYIEKSNLGFFLKGDSNNPEKIIKPPVLSNEIVSLLHSLNIGDKVYVGVIRK